jgi:methyl-accepting chemotaxis protein
MRKIIGNPLRSSMSITTKLFLLTGALILSALVTINVLNYQYTKKEVEDRILKIELPTLTNELVTLVQKELASPIALSALTANNDFLIDWLQKGETSTETIRGYFNYLKGNKPISVVNLVSDKTLKCYNENGIFRTIDRKDKWYFNFKQKNVDKEFNINYSKAGKLTLFINHRIQDTQNHFLGLVGVGLDLGELTTLILSKKIGKNGNVMLIDQDGYIKMHQNAQIIDKNNEKVASKNILKQTGIATVASEILQKKKDSYRYQKGKEKFVLKTAFIPEFQWFLLVEISETEILEPIYQIFLWNILVGFLITIVIILLGIWFIQNLVFYPLQNLSQGLFSFFDFLNRKVPTSELIKVTAKDEFGELSTIINDNIQTIQQGIEQDNILIKETVLLVDRITEGFLDTRLNGQGYNLELNNLKEEINQMLDKLEASVGTNINHIIQTMQAYASMNFGTVIGNPKGEIEKNVNEMGKSIHEKQQEILEQRDAIAQKNTQISNSIQAALTIQQAILPYQEKMDRLLKDYFVLNKPRDVVSGDFYWLNPLNPNAQGASNEMILVIADCTGHGVEGAFMTLIGNILLDKIVRVWNVASPEEILTRLHEEIYIVLRQGETQNKNGMDAVVLHLQYQAQETVITFENFLPILLIVLFGKAVIFYF